MSHQVSSLFRGLGFGFEFPGSESGLGLGLRGIERSVHSRRVEGFGERSVVTMTLDWGMTTWLMSLAEKVLRGWDGHGLSRT